MLTYIRFPLSSVFYSVQSSAILCLLHFVILIGDKEQSRLLPFVSRRYPGEACEFYCQHQALTLLLYCPCLCCHSLTLLLYCPCLCCFIYFLWYCVVFWSGDESVEVFYRLFMHVLSLEIQLLRGKGCDSIKHSNPVIFYTCPMQGPGFPTPHVVFLCVQWVQLKGNLR